MTTKYAIRIVKDALPLITVLNNGVEPLIEDKETYYVFDVTSPTEIENHEILGEDDVYDDRGHMKFDALFVII